MSAFAGDGVRVSVAGAAFVHGDPTRLRQVLANLIANGLRHGTHVEIALSERDGRVVVDVMDDGAGIAPGIDPFVRSASGVGSSGLGLWLGREIAGAHGGALDLVSGTRQGTCFRLSLPSASGEC